MREGMLSHCDIETGVYVGYKEGKSMARKLVRRHTGYIAGSVAMKEELAPKKKREKRITRQPMPKKDAPKRKAKKGARLLHGAISREERARILREREMGHVLQQERLQEKAPANFAMVFSVALFMFFMGGLLFHYIQLQTEVNTRMHRIEQKKREIEKLKQKNDALQNAINAALDPEKIYTIATEELGMVYPGENQVIEYKKQESEYVRQYENIPKH